MYKYNSRISFLWNFVESETEKNTFTRFFFCFKFLFFYFHIFLVCNASFDGLTNSAKKYSSLYGSSVLSSWYFMDFFYLQKVYFFGLVTNIKRVQLEKPSKSLVFHICLSILSQKMYYQKNWSNTCNIWIKMALSWSQMI